MALRPLAQADDEVIGAINTTPLVDVMLVLLIIFLITIPVVSASVPVQLPQQNAQPRQTPPDLVTIAVDRQGQIFLFDAPVASPQALQTRLAAMAAQGTPPEVQIRGDVHTAFGAVREVMQAVQAAGIVRVGFVTEPSAGQ